MNGKDIRAARRQLGRMWPSARRSLSQAQLATVLGVSDQTVRAWEAGRTAIHPSASILIEQYLAGWPTPERLRILKP